jgi:hypothetical protein
MQHAERGEAVARDRDSDLARVIRRSQPPQIAAIDAALDESPAECSWGLDIHAANYMS